MDDSERPPLDVARGLCGAGVSWLASTLLAVPLAAGLLTLQGDGGCVRDVGQFFGIASTAFVGTSVVGLGAGWLSFAPAGKPKFGLCFAAVALGSITLWCAVGWCGGWIPTRGYGTWPLPAHVELMWLAIPAAFVTAVFTAFRVWKRTWRLHQVFKPSDRQERTAQVGC